MATYFIADPHYFHEGIVRLCNRPFANASEMTATMAANWRAVVRPTDDVICVGDFAHRADPTELRKLFDSLPGNKHLVVGNHDGPATLALGWKTIKDIAYVTTDATKLVLCHYGMRVWPGQRKGALQLYGHSHGRLPGNSQSCDIGVDVLGFAPVRLSTIKAYLKTLSPPVDPEGGNDLDNDATFRRD